MCLCGSYFQFHFRNSLHQTPLHLAASKGHCRIVHILIEEFHAEIDPVDTVGSTPLQVAAELGHDKVVKVLLKHEADVSQKKQNGSNGSNVLDIAIDNGHE